MKTIVLQLALIVLSCVSACSQVRQSAVAGSFYPSGQKALEAELGQLFAEVEDKTVDKHLAAMIVPHAGYVFSGSVAASAFAKLSSGSEFERIFVIGTSHHMLLKGASVYAGEAYQTPLGKVAVDIRLARQLAEENRLISFVPEAHEKEHSLEVQLPFLQYRLDKPFKIVPILIGTRSEESCRALAKILRPWFTPENLFVISSDFSHYPSHNAGTINDRETGRAVMSNSPAEFMKVLALNERKQTPGLVTSCCGWSSVLTLLALTSEEQDIRVKHVKYMNSGDTRYGDQERVVGYHAFVFTRAGGAQGQDAFVLTPDDKRTLLKIAREAIDSKLDNKSAPGIPEEALSENLLTHCGAFVTLHKDGGLRGCIGRFMPEQPLYLVVQEMARAAAFHDTRFLPVEKKEMKKIDIEMSVLTPLKRIHSIDEFRLGEQGIYMIKGNRSGTFLPQVAESTGWSKEEFFGHCARDKAGIGWEGWKEAELYTYEALIFDEQHIKLAGQ